MQNNEEVFYFAVETTKETPKPVIISLTSEEYYAGQEKASVRYIKKALKSKIEAMEQSKELEEGSELYGYVRTPVRVKVDGSIRKIEFDGHNENEAFPDFELYDWELGPYSDPGFEIKFFSKPTEDEVYQEEKVVKYGGFTLRLMRGLKKEHSFSRFRRQPKKNCFAPTYLHGENGKISNDYSNPSMFFHNPENWEEKLGEVCYLEGAKRGELVRRSGQVYGFTNKEREHLKNINLKVKTDPIVELRLY